jgi:hypothetical protein
MLVKRLMELVRDTFGEASLLVAVDEFWGWPESDDDLTSMRERLERNEPLLWPWFLFNWTYDPDDFDEPIDFPEDITVAERYRQQRGPTIDSLEAKIIIAFNRKPFSFYEVIAVESGKSIQLKDVLTGVEITVQERAGSEYLQPADLVFGRAAMVDGVGMIVGLGTTIIPPRYKPELIDLRNQFREGGKYLTDERLGDLDLEIRLFYLDMEDRLHRPPRMTNSEGDPLEFHKLVYEIDSAAEAFDKLAPLCATKTQKELRESATLDNEGRIVEVEFSWSVEGFKGHSGLSNTILGTIRIDNQKMTVDVNSAKRAEKVRREVDQRMGGRARFRLDEVKDLDALMERSTPSGEKSASLAESEELMKNPEVQAQLAEMMDKHWEGWVDEKLPALKGKTPREAVRSADGREALEALLVDIERRPDVGDSVAAHNLRGVRRVREILGLNKEE